MDLKNLDIKELINDLVDKIKSDDKLLENFRKEPIKTLEGLIGVDLPDDKIEALVNGIKAKIDLEKIGDALSGLKGLFGK